MCRKKYTAAYTSEDNIDNFKIRVRLKQIEKGFDTIEESRIFAWQEKVEPEVDKFLYSYVNNDVFDFEKSPVTNSKFVTKLWSQNVRICHTMQEDTNKKSQEFDFAEGLSKAIVGAFDSPHRFHTMHIMANLGEMVNNIQISFETLICVLKYDYKSKCLLVYPDFTLTSPYFIRIETDSSRCFEFYLEDASEKHDLEETIDVNEVPVKKACQPKQGLLHMSERFEEPKLGKSRIFLFCEILTAKNFEYNEIYVQYLVDLAENGGLKCRNQKTLSGSTQTCRSNKNNVFHYGFSFEICLECKIEDVLKVPHIYFEVISKDSWDRYRTEGLSYVALPVLRPGLYEYTLHCIRLSGGHISDMRRFFIGDAFSYSKPSWLSVPRDYENSVLNKYSFDTSAGNGEILFRVRSLHQSHEFPRPWSHGDCADEPSSELAKSVRRVVTAFKMAKRKMIDARKKSDESTNVFTDKLK